MKKLLLFTIAIAAFFSFNSRAGFYIDPHIGYVMSGDVGQPGDTNSGIGGATGFGSKIGFKTLGLSYGLDYQAYGLEDENTPASQIDTTEMGFFIGYSLPLIRVWATYVFSSEGENTTTSPAATYSGGGYNIGVGYTGLPLISINLEMKYQSWDEAEAFGATATVSPAIDYEATVLSISFPFSL